MNDMQSWQVPKLDESTGKWVVKVFDSDENLLRTMEYDTEEQAHKEMRKEFIDHLLSMKPSKVTRCHESSNATT